MYILVFRIINEYILSVRGDGSIDCYETPEKLLEAFKSFTTKFTPGSGYESYASAGIGMMNLQPKGVRFSEEVYTLKELVLDETIKKYWGLGFHPVVGVRVHELILGIGENINVWKESMIAAGIYDPLQSDFQDPFNFTL